VTKGFEWDDEKNQKLINERGISFESIVAYIEAGAIAAIVPGAGRFSHQKQFLVIVDSYIYIVPFVEGKSRIFLKTIIPSRKMTRLYLSGGI
jgi:uncharacterized DUF497 family protein